MRVLFLGGTRFIGRAMVVHALELGHHVTLFHRGQSGADLFPQVEHVLGDRFQDLNRLKGDWDVVLDISGYTPRALRISCDALQGRVGRYVFISTFAVFSTDPNDGTTTEASPVRPWPSHRDPEEPEDKIDQETYGPLKVLCENIVSERFARHVHVRPSIIAGPHDTTDRFTKWVRLAATADHVRVAASPTQNVRLTDVRDLASFTLGLLDRDVNGPVNISGPIPPRNLGQMWEEIQEGVGRKVSIEWNSADAEALPLTNAWAERPADFSHAVSLGFTPRPLSETASATWAWCQESLLAG